MKKSARRIHAATPTDRARFAEQPYVLLAGAGEKARVRVKFDRGARLDDTRAFVTTRCVAIARGASRACSCGARARRPCTHHGCVCLGPLADRAKRARRRGRFDACVRPVLFDRRAGARAGTIRGGKSPRAARPRGDLCACPVRRDRVRACEKSPGGARFADTSSPKVLSALFLAKTSVVRLPSPGVRRAHRRARSHASRLPGTFATRSRSPKRLTQDPQPTHKTMRPPAGRGFGGGGRGFGGRGSPGGRGFGGRGGRGGRGGFDEGPPDTVVGAYHSFSLAFIACVPTGRRTRRAMPRSFPPVEIVGLP